MTVAMTIFILTCVFAAVFTAALSAGEALLRIIDGWRHVDSG